MKLKTFRANSMADALAAVKADLGRDAVILHTRTLKTGGFLGLRRKSVVEVTASDEAPVQRRRAQAASTGRTGAPNTVNPRLNDPALHEAPQFAPIRLTPTAAAAQSYARQSTASPSRSGAEYEGPGLKADASPAAPTVALPPVAPAEPPLTTMRVRERPLTTEKSAAPALIAAPADDIRRELSDIKLLVSQVLRSSANGSGMGGVGGMGGASMLGATPDALFAEYLRLLESQVSRDIADRIIGAVRDELHPGELADAGIVRTTVLRHLSTLIQVAEPAKLPTPRSGERVVGGRLDQTRVPFVLALVGPTGVGKTTTIAKLAAAYKLRQGRSVALITSDTYRIAAVDQLRTYADIIGLQLRVVQSPAEMAAAVQALSHHDIVLIDSAGRSQHNTERLAELADFVAAANPDETHLVLSSTAAPEVMYSAADAFAAVRPNRVILTKLDEAVHFGVVVNIMQRLTTRLSFVTMGQEVPDHIEPGSPERLARLILDRRVDRAPPPPPESVVPAAAL